MCIGTLYPAFVEYSKKGKGEEMEGIGNDHGWLVSQDIPLWLGLAAKKQECGKRGRKWRIGNDISLRFYQDTPLWLVLVWLLSESRGVIFHGSSGL